MVQRNHNGPELDVATRTVLKKICRACSMSPGPWKTFDMIFHAEGTEWEGDTPWRPEEIRFARGALTQILEKRGSIPDPKTIK